MEEKLRRLMKHEGINSTRLAEILGIQASGISHIMSGRNKPSYDFLTKLLQKFPQINPDWLLLDRGPMYRDEVKKSTAISPINVSGVEASAIGSNHRQDLFAAQSHSGAPESGSTGGLDDKFSGENSSNNLGNNQNRVDLEGVVGSQKNGFGDVYSESTHKVVAGENSILNTPQREFSASQSDNAPRELQKSYGKIVERIVVFYRDKTFAEYLPI